MKRPAVLLLVLMFACVLPTALAEDINPREPGIRNVQVTFNAEEGDIVTENPTGRLSIRITNLRNSDGYIGIALFRSKEGFPDDSENAFALTGTEPTGTEVECVLENIPYGTYAVSVLHDENRNRKMDKTWIGKPKEGFGTSNNPKVRFGPPKFDESNFTLGSEEVALIINMNYF